MQGQEQGKNKMNETNGKDMKSKAISGLLWRLAERCGAEGVAFVVSIVLARLLAPEDYGLIALVTVFITISQVFVDSGMGSALIQKKNADDLDFSSVFYFNIAACLALYALLFLLSPVIAAYYGKAELTAVIRVLGIMIVISAVKNVQQAYVSKHMLFKRFFFATLGGTLGAAMLGIAMAYAGFGVWALVAQQLFNTLIDTIILWVTVKWRPVRAFSFKRLKGLFSYGWKLLVSSLIDTVYNNLRQLIIGKVYSSSDLAYYNKGRSFPNMIVLNINSSINSVLLPAMSQSQDDIQRVKSMTRRSITVSSYMMWPLMIGLAVVAEPVIRILLTEKWIQSVPYLRVFCIIFAFQPIQTANLNAIKAMGRSGMFLKLEIVKKIIGVGILLIAMHYGVFAIALSLLVYNVMAQIINSFPNRKLLGYSYFEQLKDIFPYIALSCVMAALIYPISFLQLGDLVTLTLQVLCGGLVYIAGSVWLKVETFQYIFEIIKKWKR